MTDDAKKLTLTHPNQESLNICIGYELSDGRLNVSEWKSIPLQAGVAEVAFADGTSNVISSLTVREKSDIREGEDAHKGSYSDTIFDFQLRQAVEEDPRLIAAPPRKDGDKVKTKTIPFGGSSVETRALEHTLESIRSCMQSAGYVTADAVVVPLDDKGAPLQFPAGVSTCTVKGKMCR